MAPELLTSTKGGHTRESDIFALGIVTFEVRGVHCGRHLMVLKYSLYVSSGVHWKNTILEDQLFPIGDDEDCEWGMTIETSRGEETWTFRWTLGTRMDFVGSQGGGKTFCIHIH